MIVSFCNIYIKGIDASSFVLKPKRGLKCFIAPTNHITGFSTNEMTESSIPQPTRETEKEPTRSLIPKMNNQLQPL
jgi:hypothetical protein